MTSSDTANVLVIGATGTIGSRLIAILGPDHQSGRMIVNGAARSDEAARRVEAMGARAIRFDLDDRLIDPERHVRALSGIDTVFLLTGYTVDMLAQSKAVIDAALEAGVQHVVHLGLMALPNTRGIHQGWHQMTEAYLERSGLGWTHLHPNMFTSAFHTLQLGAGVYPVPASGPVTFKGYISPEVTVSWIDTEDIAQAAAAVLRDPARHNGKTYNLAVEANTFPELVAQAGAHFGRDFSYEAQPVEQLEAFLEHAMDRKYGESGVNTMRMVNNGLLPDFGDVHDDYDRLTGNKPTMWADIFKRNPEWFVPVEP